MKAIATLVLIWIICPSTGFLPEKYLAWTLNAVDLSLASTITHKDMSRAAILDVAADFLRDNPNPESKGSSSRISALSSLSEKSLITAYYGEKQRSRTKTFEKVIEVINDANADVDLDKGSGKDAAAHFDSEQFQTGQNRLVLKRQTIVTEILMSNFDVARKETGRLFHTLQDFYSHSNWIENGNRSPYPVLGKSNKRPGNIVGSAMQTCTNCEAPRSEYTITNIFNAIRYVFRPYPCQDNIVSHLRRSGMLTSGYHDGQRDINGQKINKPRGKCSHGGFLDATRKTYAQGGINKDSPFEVWSPHYYLYDEAARVAQQATVDILQEIRNDVNDDRLFGMYLGLNVVQDISIAYVIDTTGSMSEELLEIQATLPSIKTTLQQHVNSFSGNMQVRYILVPFNDPGTIRLLEVIRIRV